MSLLTIATYNIHSCIGTDRRFAPERIVEVIRALDTDIIALQEVGWHLRGEKGFDQFAFLRQQTDYTVLAGLTKHHAGAHFGNALLTRVPVQTATPFSLSVRLRVPRGGIVATLNDKGRQLRVISAHFGLDPWERSAQFRAIGDQIQHAVEPVIFLGDLNEFRSHCAPIARLKQDLPNEVAVPSFPTRAPRLKLDRIFTSPDLEILSSGTVRRGAAGVASDHCPVRATLRWRENALAA